MKTEGEIRERMDNAVTEFIELRGETAFEDLDESEQEQVARLQTEVSVLHWILEGY